MTAQIKLIGKTKNGENVPSLEVVEEVGLVQVVLVLVDNQDQQNSEVLYIFTSNKFYAYLLNVESSNLLFLKNFNTEFDDITVTFTDENG